MKCQQGVLCPSTSYNKYSFELQPEQNWINTTAIIICVEEEQRSSALLLQLFEVCRDIKVFVGCNNAKIYKNLLVFCERNHFLNFVELFLLKKMCYGNSLLYLSKKANTDIQIVMRDAIRWCNRDDVKRLIYCFLNPKVVAASPQIATATTSEGNLPRIIYGGGSVKDSSFSTELFKGRLQNIYGELDPAWTNRPLDMLSSYCFAIRNEAWKLIETVPKSIINAEQFVIELSFSLLSANKLCEYSAQSSFWLDEKLGDGSCLKKYQKTDCYWHWLKRYGGILENIALRDNWLYRSWKTHLNIDFHLYVKDLIPAGNHRRILIYTHELSLTGAPIVLFQAVQILQQAKFDILVISPEDGPLRQQYLDNGNPVIIDPSLNESDSWLNLAADFDLTIINTVVPYKSIELIGKTNIPVLWWLHDSRSGYQEWLRYVLPKDVNKNIHIYAVSPYAKKVILDYRPNYKVEILLYGLNDFSTEECMDINFNLPNEKIIFVNIGQFMNRKGQDVLAQAIELLDPTILQKSYFLFVGSVIDNQLYQTVQHLLNKYPENIGYIKSIAHEHMKCLYNQIDVVICSSRDDPLPTFITEAMISSKICLCSENTGFGELIENGVNGFLYKNNDAQALSNAISYIVNNINTMESIRKAGRRLYETMLSESIFKKNLLKAVERIIENTSFVSR